MTRHLTLVGSFASHGSQLGQDLLGGGKGAGLVFAVDQLPVRFDVENPSSSFDQLRLNAYGLPDRGRQTDGLRLIVSHGAVRDGNGHGGNLFPNYGTGGEVVEPLTTGRFGARFSTAPERWWKMPTTQAVVFHEFGSPAKVASFERVELPEPGTDEVVVRMHAAPIHPADLNRLEGRYGEKPDLPSIGGIEGCGEVESVGCGVTGIVAGDCVALAYLGTWAERVVVAANRLVPLPAGIDDGLAAMLILNPATAWRMLHDFVDLQQGEWVILNAANSSVGRCAIEIARAKGWRSLAVVRRSELIDELQALGADSVCLDDDSLGGRIKAVTDNAPIRLALNAVGGASALRLANALAPGGTVVTYGAMGRQALQMPNGLLIFKDLRFRGFWVTQWFRHAGAEETQAMMKSICELAAKGVLTAQVAATFALSDSAKALEAAAGDRRGGKILFRM